MNFARKIKIVTVIVIILLTVLHALLGILPWVSEPRDYIMKDQTLMEIHPFTCSMFSIISFVSWVCVMKIGIRVLKFFDELDKHLRSKSENVES